MSDKHKDMIRKENSVQAIVVADSFNDEFIPISNETPLPLLPLVNKPLIDYTLEFLSLGGVEETFLFVCSHIDTVKAYINESIKKGKEWSFAMKVNIIASESCRSFGDCLRDLDAKGLLRGDFILIEPGTISNIHLLPLMKKHAETVKLDKGAAMTLIYQETSVKHRSIPLNEEIIVAMNESNRILFHKKLTQPEKKIEFPLEIFLENSKVSLKHNLKDTHIAICSSSVLPLFTDNFDFQTKDDFVRGLLMNEEIMGSTVYCQIVKGNQYGSAVTSWRMYQTITEELRGNWIFPIIPRMKHLKNLKQNVVTGSNFKLGPNSLLNNSVIGDNVQIGKNVQIIDSFIFSNVKIEDNCIISHSIIGTNTKINSNSKVTAGTILGNNVVLPKETFTEDSLIQSDKPEDYDNEKLGEKAYRLKLQDDEDEDKVGLMLSRKLSRLHIGGEEQEEDDYETFTESEDEESYTHSPPPDDTKLFFTEVVDSLTRGFEDELHCDNLILEINSSRYAYNVTVKEVNFFVTKAILNMSLRLPTGPQYFSQLSRLLSFFSPIFKNYLRNESAMQDCLEALEEVATSDEKLVDKWVTVILKWLYDKDHVSEEAIIDWSASLDTKSKIYKQVKPFVDWLEEADEESSEEE